MASPSRPQRDPVQFPYEQDLLNPTPHPISSDETEIKVQQYQDQLLQLKRQQEEIERQKRELEELSRKQREFEQGRNEMVEKLTRGLVILERQAFETKRELEQVQLVRENFSEQLNRIEEIHPEQWEARNLLDELGRALAYIDQAKSVHQQARARLSALASLEASPGDLPASLDPLAAEAPAPVSFARQVSRGLAYSLPALIVQIVLAVLYYFFFLHRS